MPVGHREKSFRSSAAQRSTATLGGCGDVLEGDAALYAKPSKIRTERFPLAHGPGVDRKIASMADRASVAAKRWHRTSCHDVRARWNAGTPVCRVNIPENAQKTADRPDSVPARPGVGMCDTRHFRHGRDRGDTVAGGATFCRAFLALGVGVSGRSPPTGQQAHACRAADRALVSCPSRR
jgi:hypothetical protein